MTTADWVAWTDRDGKVHDARPIRWTDDDEHDVGLWLRSERVVHDIIGADVVQYIARMERHINARRALRDER